MDYIGSRIWTAASRPSVATESLKNRIWKINPHHPPQAAKDRDVLYLKIEHVLVAYAEVFDCSLDEAASQLRGGGRELLEAVLARPQNYAYYQDADLALQAATLAHGIAEGQLFIEGNKRTALTVLYQFLEANGFGLSASQDERFFWMRRLSEGETVEELGDRIRAALVPVGQD